MTRLGLTLALLSCAAPLAAQPARKDLTPADPARGAELKRRFEALGLRDVRVDAEGNVFGERPGAAAGLTVNPAHAMGRAIACIADFQVPNAPKATFNVGMLHAAVDSAVAAEKARWPRSTVPLAATFTDLGVRPAAAQRDDAPVVRTALAVSLAGVR